MKLINQKVEELIQEPGLQGVYKQIELAGRTCYKSEDKITDDSAEAFVQRMIDSGHLAMLEHGTVYLKQQIYCNPDDNLELSKYKDSKYSTCFEYYFPNEGSKGIYVTTNYRVLIENNWLNDLQYLCEPTEFHERRKTFRIITDRGVTHELVRHRVFSFAQESTRYCNYSKDKFGGELTFIIPEWLKERLPAGSYKYNDTLWEKDGEPAFDADIHNDRNLFLWDSARVKDYYNQLVNEFSWKAEEARQILPVAVKSEIIMTGFKSDWGDFLKLRAEESTGKVHPNMKDIAIKLAYEVSNT